MNGSDPTRRRFLGTAFGLTAITGSASAATDSSEPGTFAVEGRQRTIATYDPERVTIETRYVSADLRTRLGLESATLTETSSIDRAEIDEDPFPRQGREVRAEPWTAEIAYEDEWRTHHRKRRSTQGVGVASADPSEPELAYPVWTYTRHTTASGFAYERSNPVNVVFDLEDASLSQVTTVLEAAGWTSLDWRLAQEYRRFGYNHLTESFESCPESWGTSNYRLNGGDHVQCWEFVDGAVGMHVHEDTPAPHSVESYASAESRVRGLYDDSTQYATTPDGLTLENGTGDHDGQATNVTGS